MTKKWTDADQALFNIISQAINALRYTGWIRAEDVGKIMNIIQKGIDRGLK